MYTVTETKEVVYKYVIGKAFLIEGNATDMAFSSEEQFVIDGDAKFVAKNLRNLADALIKVAGKLEGMKS